MDILLPTSMRSTMETVFTEQFKMPTAEAGYLAMSATVDPTPRNKMALELFDLVDGPGGTNIRLLQYVLSKVYLANTDMTQLIADWLIYHRKENRPRVEVSWLDPGADNRSTRVKWIINDWEGVVASLANAGRLMKDDQSIQVRAIIGNNTSMGLVRLSVISIWQDCCLCYADAHCHQVPEEMIDATVRLTMIATKAYS